MTESWWFNLLVTLLIIAASGFFVIIEFSLMGARRNRLEEDAENSRTARAGLCTTCSWHRWRPRACRWASPMSSASSSHSS